MRFRDLFLYVVATFGPLALFFNGWLDFSAQRFMADAIQRDDARREAAIILDEENWCEFQIPHQATHVRVLTNASVSAVQMPEKTQADPRTGWRYSIEYEWVDAQGRVFGRETYHFRSRVIEVVDDVTGQRIHPTFIGLNSRPSTQTRVLHLALRGPRAGANRVRIRLKGHDASIDEVVSRVTARVPRPDYDSRTTWNRLSRERRQILCRYCVYDYYLLSDRERANLLKWQWTETPTVGEFPKRFLYFIGDREDKEVDDWQIPAGRFGSPNWAITTALPDKRGRVAVEMFPLQSDPTAPETKIRWYGAEASQTQAFSVPAGEARFEMVVSPGMLRIEPGTDMVVRLFWKPVDEEDRVIDEPALEITPEPKLIQTFVVDHRHVDYHVSHVGEQATPLRITLRRVFDTMFQTQVTADSGEPLTRSWVHWEFLAKGHVVRQGIVPVDPQISMYDYLWFAGQPRLVSDVTCWYFNVPSGVDQVRVVTDGTPLLVRAAVRPAGLPRSIMVPEDYGMTRNHDSRYRTWFTLKPERYDDLLRENRAMNLRAQSRPPDLDPQIMSGNYAWHRFEPDWRAIQNRLWVPVPDDMTLRDEAREAAWQSAVPGSTFEYQVRDVEPWNSPGDVKFAWSGERARPGRVRIRVDGRVVLERDLASLHGEIRLPVKHFAQGHTLSIDGSSDVAWWVNGLELPDQPRWMQRDAVRVDDETMAFQYRKTTAQNESLTLLAFPESGESTERLKLRIRISPEHVRGDGPMSCWTLTDRIYDVRADDACPALLFDSGKRVGTGHRCFIHLNADLPPGEYTIRVDLMDGPAAVHALLYQTRPGTHPQRSWNWVRAEGRIDVP